MINSKGIGFLFVVRKDREGIYDDKTMGIIIIKASGNKIFPEHSCELNVKNF